MFDKFYVGRDLISFSDNGKYKPVSRITLKVDEENVITAGNDTGLELVADCPFATQEIADALLAQYRGYVYQAYEAAAVNIDPAAELGDGLTADGHYSVISRTSDNGNGYPNVSAPGEAELDDEYPSAGPMTQEFNRKVAKAYSLISKTAEEIRLEVVKKLDEDEANTLISAAIGKIELSVSSKNGSTSFVLTDGTAEISAQTLNLTVPAVNVSGKLTASQIDATNLKVDAANVTGTLTASQISLSGAITWNDLSSGVQSTINGAYDSGVSENEVTTLITSTLVSSPTIAGGEFYDINEIGRLTLSYDGYAWLTFEGVNSGREIFSVGGTDRGGTTDVTIMTFADETIFMNYASTGETSLAYNVNIEGPLAEALESTTIINKLKSVLGLS